MGAAQYIIVPVAQKMPPVTFKPGVATGIGRWIMLSAINFNDEPFFNAGEIGNERTNGMLSAKSAIGHLAPTKVMP